MYNDNLASLCPRIPSQETCFNSRPKDISRNILFCISKDLDIPMDNHDNKPWTEIDWICPSGHETIILYTGHEPREYCPLQIESAALRLGGQTWTIHGPQGFLFRISGVDPRTMDLFL
jgi:hypothetical protein